MFWVREVGLSGELGGEGVASGVASWMCGGGSGVGGWWGVAGSLGLGFGRHEGEGVVIHCK